MTMMFEVADLAVASPATVSRCGMVYLEPSYIGLDPFVECWLKKVPEPIWQYKEKFEELFQFFLNVSFEKLFTLFYLTYNFKNKLLTMKILCSVQSYFCVKIFLDNFLFQPAIKLLRKELREIVPTVDGALVFSLLKMLDCFFEPFVPKEVKKF